jgi:hypothetical protein
MHCFSFLIYGAILKATSFVLRVAHQQTEARNDPSVVGKAEIRGQFLFAQGSSSHDAQNRLNSGILRHNLDFFLLPTHVAAMYVRFHTRTHSHVFTHPHTRILTRSRFCLVSDRRPTPMATSTDGDSRYSDSRTMRANHTGRPINKNHENHEQANLSFIPPPAAAGKGVVPPLKAQVVRPKAHACVEGFHAERWGPPQIAPGPANCVTMEAT